MSLTRLLAVLGLALTWLVLSPAPAYACSCAQRATGGHVEGADVIVRGTIDAREPADADGTGSVTYAVTVQHVYQGSAGRALAVRSPASSASCGLEDIELGEEYVVFAYTEGGDLWANLCGGTAPATPGLVADVEAITGAPVPPSDDAPPGAASASADGERSGSWWAWAVPAGVVGLAGGVVLRRRRRP